MGTSPARVFDVVLQFITLLPGEPLNDLMPIYESSVLRVAHQWRRYSIFWEDRLWYWGMTDILKRTFFRRLECLLPEQIKIALQLCEISTMHATMPPWQAVFFDFDGVIADSTDVKARAFATLFAPYGADVQEAVVRYHLDNGGMPRHEKIRHCFITYAGKQVTETELAQAGATFSSLVLEEVVLAPLIPGALMSLQQLQQMDIPAFVVSGTPHDEMQLIVQRKGLGCFFQEVHGSPSSKAAIITDILTRYSFTPDRCLFIGDALADYQAAESTGLCFQGIVPHGASSSIFPENVRTSAVVTLSLYR